MTTLLLIAASGMDWRGFDDRTRSGALPAMAKLRARGFAGPLQGAPVVEGLAAYATIATGVEPEVHGVWRPFEAWGGGLRATSRAAWRVWPVWARLEAAGVSTGSVGWPATQPGVDWAGVHIDPTFANPNGKTPEDWSLPLDCAPFALRDEIAARRVHPLQITPDMVRGFVPDLKSVNQSRPTPLPAFALAMARGASAQGAAVWLLNEQRPEAVFVDQAFLGAVRRIAERERRYAVAAAGAWRLLDEMIGRLARLVGPRTLLVVVSPGWLGRPGVILGAGPSLAIGADFRGASILDVAPTALAAFSLEDRALAGRSLARPMSDGPCSPAPSPPLAEPAAPDLDLLRLVAEEGFPPPLPAPEAWRAQGLAELSRIMLRRNAAAAEATAREALRINPDNLLALQTLAFALFGLEQAEGLVETADGLDRVAPGRGWGALARGAYHILRRERGEAWPCLEQAERAQDIETRLMIGSGWLMVGNARGAERVFRSILDIDPDNTGAEIGLAHVWMMKRDFIAAEAAVQRALSVDPENCAAYEALAKVYDETGRTSLAERARLRAEAK
jgi:tetratricopeptide (TPR) repeat protein